MKESFHQSRYIKYGRLKKANTIEGFEQYSLMPEEHDGTIYLYKKQGLFIGDSYNYLKAIRNVEKTMNDCNTRGYYSPNYNFKPYEVPWYNIIYKILRLW